jgi:hypothetical protein
MHDPFAKPKRRNLTTERHNVYNTTTAPTRNSIARSIANDEGTNTADLWRKELDFNPFTTGLGHRNLFKDRRPVPIRNSKSDATTVDANCKLYPKSLVIRYGIEVQWQFDRVS